MVMLVCLLNASATAPDTRGEIAALRAAKTWLAMVDAGDYDQSWETAAEFFRNNIPKERWREVMQGVRTPLGELVTREAKEKSYETEMPGAPDGHYVVIHFSTIFENKRRSVEMVTPMMDPDGKWRVAGYFIN